MKKNLSVRLLFGAALVASLASCRSEDFLNSHEEAPPSKFRVFTAQKDETINYGKGFKTLLEHYDDIHKVQHTAEAVRNALKNSLETTGEYVEMNIRSQDFKTKTNERYTLFPLIKNQQVDGIIIAVLKENETQVEFLKMYPEAENYSEMLKLFREVYLKNTLPQRLAAKANGSCSSDGTPCDTGEVIITMPGAGGGYTGGTWNGDTLPAGGCLPYDNCLNPEGGGSSGSGETTPTNNNAPENPCEKTKNLMQKQEVKDVVNDLRNHLNSGTGGEKGWRLNKSGPPTQTTENGAHSVNFGDPSTMNGGYHNHTGTGVNMFSSTDISTLIEIVRYQNIGNAGNGYMGIVAPNDIHYIMYFNGSHSDLPIDSYNERDLEDWNTAQAYWKDNLRVFERTTYSTNDGKSLNSKGLEKIFFKTLKEMGLENKITLQKVDGNNVFTINLQSNGIPNELPCLY